jgi:hypothetical protein
MRDGFMHYVLDDEHRLVEEPDSSAWNAWYENDANRIVDWTQITSEVTVSTIFLGFNLNFSLSRHRKPALFETMIFGGALDHDRWRYATWDEAQAGHKAAVRKARAAARMTT